MADNVTVQERAKLARLQTDIGALTDEAKDELLKGISWAENYIGVTNLISFGFGAVVVLFLVWVL